MQTVTIIGAGLAGCEAALQLANRNIPVVLYEQKPKFFSPAHTSPLFAELVCSNSLKSTKRTSAAGLLKQELALMKSYLLEFALQASVDAGNALAVNREEFSRLVTHAVSSHLYIDVKHERVDRVPDSLAICAAGPLCSDELFSDFKRFTTAESLSFFDAAAPIVEAQSLDRTIVFEQSRWDQTSKGDYLNCPMNKEEYEEFWEALVHAELVIKREFEQKDLFCACQPVEEVARTGVNSLRFGALKPVGIVDPRTGKRPWANVQLRAENSYKTAYNLVGFQTNLTFGEQKRVFSLIPGIKDAQFSRFGVMHRNSFIDAPHTVDQTFKVKGSNCRLAGQISGTEGYTEAIASGLLAGLNTFAEVTGLKNVVLPQTTAFGSLVSYATNPETSNYQPMHVNFGIFQPLSDQTLKKQARYEEYSKRALADLSQYIAQRSDIF